MIAELHPPQTVLSTQALGFRYGGRVLFSGLNLQFELGQIVALLGTNGIGKTTLLKCCAKVLKPTQGSVHSDTVIGFVPQASELMAPYSVVQVVAMGRSAQPGLFKALRSTDHAAIAQAIAWCELEPLMHHTFTTLSGGERQRVLIARTLAQSASVIVLDEPMAAMDLHHQIKLMELLKCLAVEMKKLIVFSTHQPQHALSIATHTILMHADQSLQAGLTKDVLTEESVEQCFSVPARLIQLPIQESTKPYVVPLI